jgi:hypothetical protein
MPCSIFGFEMSAPRQRFGPLALIISGSLILAGLPGGFAVCEAARWSVTPRLSLSGGIESDLVLDPDLSRSVVPGGSYVDVAPSILTRKQLGRSGDLTITAQTVLERFLNGDGRLLYAQSLYGELTHRRRNGVRSRIATSGSYFDDSERPTVRRVGGGIEGGLGVVHSDWSLEAVAGIRGRRYPNLLSADDLGEFDTYAETGWHLGAIAALYFGTLLLRPEIGLQSTEARDPHFDSTAYDLSLRAHLPLNSQFGLSAVASAQSRNFSQRFANDDHDSYLQGGVGMDYSLSARAEFVARVSIARYGRTTGEDQDSHRLELGFRYIFGLQPPDFGAQRAELVSLREKLASHQAGRGPGVVQLRVFSPDATSVHVSGDFNRWSAKSHSLTPAGDGWWNIDLDLSPGIYQYRFLVDGVWIPPTDAEITIDDGFGGKNAILEIPETPL